ncbi:MAG: hypothetical protein GJT30_07465 [Geobacter sp.]|nr:hypothetical protein [Geobacter sp.]
MDRLSAQEWDFIGCHSTERRCVGALSVLELKNKTRNKRLFRVVDPPSQYSARSQTLLADTRTEFGRNIVDTDICELPLFTDISALTAQVSDFIAHSCGKIIVDISSFPKRFFFPIVKLLINNVQVTDLIATYTFPATHSGFFLAENPESWLNIPMFGPNNYPDIEADYAVVGVGYHTYGLPELLKNEYSKSRVKLLFPFPPGPPSYQRSWDFIREIEKYYPLKNKNQIVRVDAHDVSDTYSYICSITNNGEASSVMAPYGPKPMSLAMCIYATLTNSPVYYTQPRIYNPDYCVGIRIANGIPDISSYCIKIHGKMLYSL